MTPLTADIARQLLRYEPETGKLFWLERPRELFPTSSSWKTWNTRFANSEAFTAPINNGYMTGRIFGKSYRAHRVAWLLQTGQWPLCSVDHINGICGDNRWVNLRDVSVSENLRNTKRASNNTSGVTGVYWSAERNRWLAVIKINGRQKKLGRFRTIEEAAASRAAANLIHGFTARHGSAA